MYFGISSKYCESMFLKKSRKYPKLRKHFTNLSKIVINHQGNFLENFRRKETENTQNFPKSLKNFKISAKYYEILCIFEILRIVLGKYYLGKYYDKVKNQTSRRNFQVFRETSVGKIDEGVGEGLERRVRENFVQSTMQCDRGMMYPWVAPFFVQSLTMGCSFFQSGGAPN